MLVAIEGADGVGKNTAATALRERIAASGRRATIIGFPRYGETVAGVTIGRLLAGEMPVAASPRAAAVLYALDRLESRDAIETAKAENDVVIFDRYIASNIAYQAARAPADERDALFAWIARLETVEFALPCPALSIYLDTPWEVARELILRKAERSYTQRSYDEYEADVALQQRVRANYAAIVERGLLGPWRIVHTRDGGETMRAPDAIAGEILGHLDRIEANPAAAPGAR